MKRLAIFLGIGILIGWAGIFRAQAQELPLKLFLRIHQKASDPLKWEAMPQPMGWSDPGIGVSDSLLWNLELLRMKFTQQQQRVKTSRENVEPVRRMQERKVRQERINWQLHIGNTEISNWSPFPDRALDARVIRYPMPRSAAWSSPAKSNGPAIRKIN